MKKLTVVILALLYMCATTGANMYQHYCMGELEDWGFGHNQSTICGNCGMDNNVDSNSGCCKDEQKFLKTDADQKAAEVNFQLWHSTFVAVTPPTFEGLVVSTPSLIERFPTSHAPPSYSGQAVYILYRSILI